MEPTQVRLTIPDSVDPTAVMGPSDIVLRRIEGVFKALISVRGTTITISGSAHDVEQALIIFSNLIQMVESGGIPTVADVDLLLDHMGHKNPAHQKPLSKGILLTSRGRSIRPQTAGQKRYVDAIENHTITLHLLNVRIPAVLCWCVPWLRRGSLWDFCRELLRKNSILIFVLCTTHFLTCLRETVEIPSLSRE